MLWFYKRETETKTLKRRGCSTFVFPIFKAVRSVSNSLNALILFFGPGSKPEKGGGDLSSGGDSGRGSGMGIQGEKSKKGLEQNSQNLSFELTLLIRRGGFLFE